MDNIINLDLICAEHGLCVNTYIKDKNYAKVYKSLVERALGILQEQGIYSLFLFLESEKDKMSKDIREMLYNLLSNNKIKLLNNDEHTLKNIQEKILTNLDYLLLAYDLLERCLIYAKYNLKAESK